MPDLFFTDATLQILQQVQNQLLAPTSADSLVKREIPEFQNPLEMRELLEEIQRILG